MSNDVFVITEHMDGKFSEISFEMVGKAKELAASWGGQTIAVALGSGVSADVFASDVTLHIEDVNLAQFNPEAYGKVIEALFQERFPRLVMFGWTATGMDLAAWLSARLGKPCVVYARDLCIENNTLVVNSQVYGGKLIAEVAPDGDAAIVACVAGAFPADAGRGSTAATKMASPVSFDDLKTKFLEAIRPAAGDVDITAQDKLDRSGDRRQGKYRSCRGAGRKARRRRLGLAPGCGRGLAAAYPSGWQVWPQGQAEAVSHAGDLWRTGAPGGDEVGRADHRGQYR
jgi:electron transfer flavoprotein alpha subunit